MHGAGDHVRVQSVDGARDEDGLEKRDRRSGRDGSAVWPFIRDWLLRQGKLLSVTSL